jgi:hypothetical protein
MAEIKTSGECALGEKPKDGTCLDKNEQKLIAKAAGASTLTEVRRKLNCPNDGCILEKVSQTNKINPIEIDEIKRTALKAPGPANTKELISNFNISDIFKQMEKKYPEFYGYEFQFSDFINYPNSEPLRKPPESMIGDKKVYGIVVNTDITGGSGIHWFALLVDIRKEPWTIEYFNSSGNKPQYPINKWMNNIKRSLCRSSNCKIILANDGFQHQKGNTECGLYSMYYIWSRLSGIPCSEFARVRIPDEKMTRFRKQLFQ